MSSTTVFWIIFLLIVVLVFGTHYIRTMAFNRHEAITFECSAVAFLLGILLIWEFGFTWFRLLLCILMLLLFTANAFMQWHFYMVLQDIIEHAFAERKEYLRNHGGEDMATDVLQTMASVAIMPSFSRFIEESKFFNNPGSFIGLIKSIMRRQRFQKKKYQMREAFAENVNLIGPCKPEIDSMMLDEEHLIPGAIHANDLALDYPDEKKGLFSYDILGFGALIGMGCYLMYLYTESSEVSSFGGGRMVPLIFMCLGAFIYTLICHLLRHYGFARYENIGYEFSVTAFMIASFRIFVRLVQGQPVPAYQWGILCLMLVLFLVLSIRNRKLDKNLHKMINEKYDRILYKLPVDTETARIKRRILTNLKLISEWTIVPYPENPRWERVFDGLAFTGKLKAFEAINKEKTDMPDVTENLIDCITPEFSEQVREEDFKYPQEQLKKIKHVDNIISFGGFILLFVLMAVGMI
ncbi:MAG: hypothetical protein K5682_09030 [Lachnospiraceae bacterium]|nr:hypothetical protein [Lachnospiraceae bacterium]